MSAPNDIANHIEAVNKIAWQMGMLFKIARRMSEMDFVGALDGESRGAQDAGWSTTLTAEQVFQELSYFMKEHSEYSTADLRILLLLYSQLAEAGGVYETLKNMLGVVEQTPFLLWPFKDLVKVKKSSGRVIGPNANATFRDLSDHAHRIGMVELAYCFENAFRDDIRNAMYHSDYILWDDGLRLRRRNGGPVQLLSYEDTFDAVGIGVAFFQTLRELKINSLRSYHPEREIVGRFSANPPMPWTVKFDPEKGTFSISSSSPGPQTTPEYLRQQKINGLLGGNVLVVFNNNEICFEGFFICPSFVDLPPDNLAELLEEVNVNNLWDDRYIHDSVSGALALSPWGFQKVTELKQIEEAFGEPELQVKFETPN